MKKYISLLLTAVVLMTAAVNFSSCRNDKNAPKETEAVTEERKEGEGTSDIPETPREEYCDTLEGKTPFDVYAEAFSTVSSMTSYDVRVTTETATDYAGGTTTANEVFYSTDGKNVIYTNQISENSIAAMTYVDGILYYTDGAVKEKLAVSAEEFNSEIGFSDSRALLFSLKQENFSGVRFTKLQGVYYLNFNITADQYNSTVNESVSGNVGIKLAFDASGKLISQKLVTRYNTQSGIVIDVTITTAFERIGGECVITAPVDAESCLDFTKTDSLDGVEISETETDHVLLDVKDHGKILIRLYPTAAPITVANFKKLVKSGFYDGLTFHRVIKGFMVQGGSPDGSPAGGVADKIKGEFEKNGVVNPIAHTRGVVSMARNAISYDSASSQFFIMHASNTNLDGEYAAFGYVIYGMDAVDSIASVEKDSDDKPLADVVITSAKFVTVK